MPISDLTVRIILLFLPGIISKLILEQLTVYKDHRFSYFVVYSLLLGFLSYFSYMIFLSLVGLFAEVDRTVIFFGALTDEEAKVDFSEIFYVCIVSIILGFMLSYMINRNFLHRFATFIRLTNKFGDIDVWGHLFNSQDDTQWAVIRDLQYDLTFEGWIDAFSDTHEQNELLLRDVIVFSSDGDELYRTPALYLHREAADITIEFPNIQFSEEIHREKQTIIDERKD